MVVAVGKLTRVVLVGVLLAISAPHAAAQIEFEARRDFLTLLAPSSEVFVADVDEDGAVDLITIEESFLVVYPGAGDGSFGPGVSFGPADLSLFGAIGLVDDDGLLDVVVRGTASPMDALIAFLGAGQPSLFGTPIVSPIPVSSSLVSLGDVDGDTVLDAIITYRIPRRMSLYRGDGAGGFSFLLDISTLGGPESPVLVEDLDMDMNNDLALGTFSPSSIDLFFGDGSGNFGAPVSLSVSFPPESVLCFDFDHDQVKDIIATIQGGTIVFFRGDGMGGFTEELTMDAETCCVQRVVAADLNEDGFQDILLTGADRGDSTGAVVTWILSDGLGSFLPPRTERSVERSRGIGTGDFDGDSNLDVAITGSAEPGVSVHLGDGDGGLGSFMESVSFDRSQIVNSPVSDWNSDGLADVVVSGADGATTEVWLFSGDSTETFTQTALIGTVLDANDLVDGDFNLDGFPDVAIAERPWRIFLGNGAGQFSEGPFVSNNSRAPGIESGDFNEDGYLDIAVPIPDDQEVRVYLSDGAGGFENQPVIVSGVDVRFLTAGDVDLDGHLDLGTARFDQLVLFGDGTGQFPQRESIPSQASNARSTVFADFDGDADLDIVVVGEVGLGGFFGRASIVENDTGRAFAFSENLVVGDAPVLVEAADFDGDGVVDLACGTQSSASIRFYQGNGDLTFGLPDVSFGIGSGLASKKMAIADIDGDGRPDLTVATADSRELSVLRNVSSGFPSATVRCLQGGVNAGQGTLQDVLFVNGTSGDPLTRFLTITPSTKLTISMTQPPSRASRPQSSFALFLWTRLANDAQLVTLPLDAGTLAFNIPATGNVRLPKRTWNNFGHIPALGEADFPSVGAPTDVLDLCAGTGIPIVFTLQGIIRDDGAAGQFPASPTNGIVVHVE